MIAKHIPRKFLKDRIPLRFKFIDSTALIALGAEARISFHSQASRHFNFRSACQRLR